MTMLHYNFLILNLQLLFELIGWLIDLYGLCINTIDDEYSNWD